MSRFSNAEAHLSPESAPSSPGVIPSPTKPRLHFSSILRQCWAYTCQLLRKVDEGPLGFIYGHTNALPTAPDSPYFVVEFRDAQMQASLAGPSATSTQLTCSSSLSCSLLLLVAPSPPPSCSLQDAVQRMMGDSISLCSQLSAHPAASAESERLFEVVGSSRTVSCCCCGCCFATAARMHLQLAAASSPTAAHMHLGCAPIIVHNEALFASLFLCCLGQHQKSLCCPLLLRSNTERPYTHHGRVHQVQGILHCTTSFSLNSNQD